MPRQLPDNLLLLQVADAKKHLITVPLTRSFSFPHKFDGIFGAAKVMLRPASEGTGVIAGVPQTTECIMLMTWQNEVLGVDKAAPQASMDAPCTAHAGMHAMLLRRVS